MTFARRRTKVTHTQTECVNIAIRESRIWKLRRTAHTNGMAFLFLAFFCFAAASAIKLPHSYLLNILRALHSDSHWAGIPALLAAYSRPWWWCCCWCHSLFALCSLSSSLQWFHSHWLCCAHSYLFSVLFFFFFFFKPSDGLFRSLRPVRYFDVSGKPNYRFEY